MTTTATKPDAGRARAAIAAKTLRTDRWWFPPLITFIGLYFHFTTGWTPSWQVIYVVPLLLLLWIAAMGLAFFLSAVMANS